jgi:signal transduction histidine kinase
VAVTRPESSALDWGTRCRTWTVGGLTLPVADICIAAFFLFATATALTFPIQYGWSLSYSLNVVLHGVLAVSQLVRRVRARTSLITTGVFLVCYAVLVALTPVNLGISLVIISAPCSVFAAARWIPHWGWGAAALTVSLIGSLANPAVLSGLTASTSDQTAGDLSAWSVPTAIASVVVITVAYAIAVQLRGRAEQQVTEIRAAVAEDRLRISRELHDLVGHGLTAVKIQAQTAKAIGTPEAAEQALDAVIAASSDSLDDVRSMVTRLRADDALPLVAEPAHMFTLIRQAQDHGIALTTAVPSHQEIDETTSDWPLLVRLVFIRVITEALTNIVRHSAGNAELNVTITDTSCTITTTNNCPDPASTPEVESSRTERHGLTGIHERVDELGGTLDHRITGGQFTLDAWFPVSTEP